MVSTDEAKKNHSKITMGLIQIILLSLRAIKQGLRSAEIGTLVTMLKNTYKVWTEFSLMLLESNTWMC